MYINKNMEYTIKLYTSEYFEQCADIEKYLWKEDINGRKERFLWTYHQNPNYHKCLSVIAITSENEVVGFRGIFINKFIVGGKSELVAQIGDTVIVPKARKHGLFSKMNRYAIENLKLEGIKIVLDTGPSWTPYYGNKKLGFEDLTPITQMYNISILRILKEKLFGRENTSVKMNNIEVLNNKIVYKITDTLSDYEIENICAMDNSDNIYSKLDYDNLKWRISRTNKYYKFIQSFDSNGSLLSFIMLSTTDMRVYNIGLMLYINRFYVEKSFSLFKRYCKPIEVLAWKPMNNSTDLKTFHKMGLFAIPLLKYIKKNPPALIYSLQNDSNGNIDWYVNGINILDCNNWNLRKLDLDSF